MSAADTLTVMELRNEPAGGRYDELLAESTEALAYAANTLRGVRDRPPVPRRARAVGRGRR